MSRSTGPVVAPLCTLDGAVGALVQGGGVGWT